MSIAPDQRVSTRRNFEVAAYGIAAGALGGSVGFALTGDTIWTMISTAIAGGGMGAIIPKNVKKVGSDFVYTLSVAGAGFAAAWAVSASGARIELPEAYPLKQPQAANEQEFSFVKRTVQCIDPKPDMSENGRKPFVLPARCYVQ